MAGEDVLYKPGISFTNPKMVKIAAPVRSNPWFYEEKGVGPLSASSKLRRWDGTTQLNRYTPVWNRVAKQRNMQKLNGNYEPMLSMQELGAAPPATSESTTTRSPLGFLESLISVVGQGATGVMDVMTQQNVQKQQVAQAQTQSYMARFMSPFGGSGSDSTWLYLLGAGVLGVGAFMYFRKRR